MIYTATITANGQITVPKALRKKLELKTGNRIVFNDSAEAVTVEREKTREEQVDEMVAALEGLRNTAYAKNPEARGRVEKLAGKTVNEMREEFDASPEGADYYYKFSPAYYYESHPEEARTPEVQAAIEAHRKLAEKRKEARNAD